MSNPRVAICIPTFNQGRFVGQAVTSACAQGYGDVEVWVSDDASTDDTGDTLAGLQRTFSTIRYHRHQNNLGISANNNWLLSQPSTEFIVRLDSDDLLSPTYVEEMVGLLVKYPKAAYAHASVQEIDAEGRPGRVRRVGGRPEYQEGQAALRAAVWGYRVAANICTFRSIALRQLSYYRAGMNFCEDWDLSARLADAGWGNVYSQKTLASYRVWQDARGVRAARKAQEIEGCIQFYERTLAPAFEKRGWPNRAIWRQRKNLALQHASVLDSSWPAADRTMLIDLLKALGDSPVLRLRLALGFYGMAGIFNAHYRLKVAARDVVKRILLAAGGYS